MNRVTKIAICIPSYNRRDKLKQAVDSLLAQSDTNFHIHVFDDHSSDGTFEYLIETAAQHENLFFQVNKENKGYVGNLNNCLALHNKYDWIGILHNDDYYNAGAIAQVKKYIAQYPSAAIVYSDCRMINKKQKVIKNDIGRLKLFKQGSEAILASLSFIPCSTTFYRSSAIAEVGFFNAAYPYSADEEYNSRIGERYDILRIPFLIATICMHGENYRYDTWKEAGFMENYEQMRQRMLNDLSLEPATRSELISSHIANTCVYIFKEFRKKGLKQDAKVYADFLKRYNMPFWVKFPYLMKLQLIRLVLR